MCEENIFTNKFTEMRGKLSISKDKDDVFYDEEINKYRSYLSTKEKRYFVGNYDAFDEAKKARNIAMEKMIIN